MTIAKVVDELAELTISVAAQYADTIKAIIGFGARYSAMRAFFMGLALTDLYVLLKWSYKLTTSTDIGIIIGLIIVLVFFMIFWICWAYMHKGAMEIEETLSKTKQFSKPDQG